MRYTDRQTTRARLMQLGSTRKEAERLRERIAEIESAATRSTAAITGMPKGSRARDMIGNYAATLADLREKLREAEGRCLFEIAELQGWINNIQNSETRLILSMRYIEGKTWLQIARAIQYTDESTPRKRAERYIRRAEKTEQLKTKSKKTSVKSDKSMRK